MGEMLDKEDPGPTWEELRAALDAKEREVATLRTENEKLRAALEKINVGEGWAAQIARTALGERM